MLSGKTHPLAKSLVPLLLVVVMVTLAGQWRVAAQDGTPAPPPPNAGLVITRAEPTQVPQGGFFSIFGTNFTPATTVTLISYGLVPSTLLDNGSLAVNVPANVPPGQYLIQVSDPAHGTASAPTPLFVQAVPTPSPTAAPISVFRAEPLQVISGQGGLLSVFGANFTNATTVRLVGIGLLTTTFINNGALTATLPETLPPGVYGIEVSDPQGGLAYSPNGLTVLAPPPSPTTPPPPTPTLEPTRTPEPPTPVPGQPSLLVWNFAADPASVLPGETVALRFEVVNQGNRPALGVSVSVDPGGKFLPANGQASVLLPDIGVGGSATVSLTVTAAMDAAPGPTTVPITMSFRDFSGEAYSSKATLSVTVAERAESSQVVMSEYAIAPNDSEPGQRVTVTVSLKNTGNKAATQVLLRVAGTADNVLLAGAQGDAFPVGDLEPGETVTLELPLIVSPTAKPGPQPQSFTISFLQEGEVQQSVGSMTIPVKRKTTPEPVMLLESYDVGKETLEPGEQFTLVLRLKNVGEGDADDLMVTFGIVDSTTTPGGDGSGDGSGTPSPGGGSSTSTTPSSTFAPLGSGGSMFVGAVRADGGGAEITQEFIVSGSVQSGVYSLPITLRYRKSDGSYAQDNLRASLVVVAPPRIHIVENPVPEMVNVGEPISIGLTVRNLDRDDFNMTTVTVEAENADVLDGAEVFVGPVKKDEESSINATVSPTGEGKVTITVTIHYLDDLNQERTIVKTYETEAMTPPPPPEDMGPPPDQTPPPSEDEEKEDDSLGRIILGFLGLGS